MNIMYNGYYLDSEYLEHHGILGQKWGVRRFQDYDGTRIRQKNISSKGELKSSVETSYIPKNARLYRVEGPGGQNGNYFTFYSGDRLGYRTTMGKWIQAQYPLQDRNKVKETEVRVTKDLKVATSDKVAETTLEIMKQEVDKRNANISNFAAASKTKQILTGYLGSKLAESLSKDTEHFTLTKDAMKHLEENEQKWAMFARSINERGKSDFDNATDKGQATMLASSFGSPSSKKFQSLVVKSLSKQGYNAMTDLAGVGGNGVFSQETAQALYLFDRSGTTENVKSRNLPTGSKYRNEYTAYNVYYNQLNKR